MQMRSHLDKHCLTLSLATTFLSCPWLMLNLISKWKTWVWTDVEHKWHAAWFYMLGWQARTFNQLSYQTHLFFFFPPFSILPFHSQEWERESGKYTWVPCPLIPCVGLCSLTCSAWPSYMYLGNFKAKAVLNSLSTSWGRSSGDRLGWIGLNGAGLFLGTLQEQYNS